MRYLIGTILERVCHSRGFLGRMKIFPEVDHVSSLDHIHELVPDVRVHLGEDVGKTVLSVYPGQLIHPHVGSGIFDILYDRSK